MDDKILESPIFDSENEETQSAGFYQSIETHLNEAGAFYPDFMTFEQEKDKCVISWSKETGYTATGVEGSWDSLAAIYDHIEGELFMDADFDMSVRQSPDVHKPENARENGVVFLKPEGNNPGVRGLIPSVDHRNIDVYGYYGFLCTAKEWLKKQEDMVLAYAFLQHHPAFWYRPDPETRPNQWVTDNGLHSLWVCPTYNDEGKTVVMMEHGAAVPPARDHHYHDPRLDVWAPTFEDGYVQTAKLLHKYFALDGSERKDIPYKPQKWEVELQERLDDYAEQDKAYKAELAAKEGPGETSL